MESTRFIKLLKKNRYTLIGVPLLVIAIAFVLVRKLPNVYTSKATLSAGLADQSQQLLVDKDNTQEQKTNQEFSNLIQMMQMRNVFDQVSYQLILHDLTSDKPYRKPSILMGYLNPSARRHAIEVYTQLYNARQPLSLSDNDQEGLYKVIESMKYDYNSLAKKIKIYRVENSDFIDVEYESDSSILSGVVVNTLCKEFIDYYTTLTKENEGKSINFLTKLLADKKDSLDERMLTLKKFKIENRVLNLNEQAKTLYAQIADYESRLEMVQKDIAANAGALKSIDDKFNANDRQYLDSKLTMINQDILLSKQRLGDLNDEYIRSGFDSSYLGKIDALKKTLSEQINQSTDKYILNPLSAKESLVTQKLTLEVAQDLAKNSVKSIKDELDRLNRKFDKLVPNEAVVQADEGGINVASQEYLDILNKYNGTSLQYNSAVKVRLLESASVGELQPSKKIVLVAISGIGSFILCLLVLFILFYIDNSIQTPVELADKTGIPVLGHLPLLRKISLLDLNELWKGDTGIAEIDEFKNQLRSLRFEIDNVLTGPSLVSVTSLSASEGKTVVSMSLASACLMIGKTVLLIDGNFDHPSITEIAKPDFFIEDYLTGRITTPFEVRRSEVFVLGNRKMDGSLFEISSEKNVARRMQELKAQFDIVLIEASALDLLNKSKEWGKIADKVVGIFESGKTISEDEKQEIKYLQTSSDKFIGWIMNKLPDQANHTKKKGA